MVRSQRKLLVGVVLATVVFIPLDVIFGAAQTFELNLARVLLVGGFGGVALVLPRLAELQRRLALTFLGALSPLAVAIMCAGTGGTSSPAFAFMWGLPLLVSMLLLEEPFAVVAATVLGALAGTALMVQDGKTGPPLAYYVMVTLSAGGLATASTVILGRHHRLELQRQVERDALLRSLTEAMPAAILVVGADGQRAWSNAQASNLVELGQDARVKTCLSSALQGDRSQLELDIAGRGYELMCGPLAGANGAVTHAIAMLLDITERRKNEAALIEANDRLLRAERIAALGTLSAGVAHEINNPLLAIAANLTFLRDDLEKNRDDDVRKLAGLVRETEEGVVRVRDIVRDLRTFAGSQEERPAVHVDLNRCIEAALSMAGSTVTQRAVLKRELARVPQVRASEPRLAQVFVNLLTNAAHATAEGQRERHTITVRTFVDAEGRVAAEVSDTGSGIPHDVLPRIFEPFFTTKPPGMGTGMGLSMCHGIVKQLGGELEVETRVGSGSTFRVRLPAA